MKKRSTWGIRNKVRSSHKKWYSILFILLLLFVILVFFYFQFGKDRIKDAAVKVIREFAAGTCEITIQNIEFDPFSLNLHLFDVVIKSQTHGEIIRINHVTTLLDPFNLSFAHKKLHAHNFIAEDFQLNLNRASMTECFKKPKKEPDAPAGIPSKPKDVKFEKFRLDHGKVTLNLDSVTFEGTDVSAGGSLSVMGTDLWAQIDSLKWKQEKSINLSTSGEEIAVENPVIEYASIDYQKKGVSVSMKNFAASTVRIADIAVKKASLSLKAGFSFPVFRLDYLESSMDQGGFSVRGGGKFTMRGIAGMDFPLEFNSDYTGTGGIILQKILRIFDRFGTFSFNKEDGSIKGNIRIF